MALAYTKHTPGKGLSYSKLMLAQLCPRKFQLEEIEGLTEPEENTDFAFGHAVGTGVQSLVANPTDLNRALIATMAAWNIGFWECTPKRKKSLFYAVEAVRLFHARVVADKTILKNYEIAYFTRADGTRVPAIELTFQVQCHDGYIYEGHIDLVLKERASPKYMILELKTTSFTNLHEAMYKNSFQALGYSVVLDSIAHTEGTISSYHVLYLVYKTGAMDYEWMLFPKSRSERISFINDLVLDIEILELYKATGIYPKRGANCYNFFKPCAYFGQCDMSLETLRKVLAPPESTGTTIEGKYEVLHEPDFIYTLEQIREHQEQAIIKTLEIR